MAAAERLGRFDQLLQCDELWPVRGEHAGEGCTCGLGLGEEAVPVVGADRVGVPPVLGVRPDHGHLVERGRHLADEGWVEIGRALTEVHPLVEEDLRGADIGDDVAVHAPDPRGAGTPASTAASWKYAHHLASSGSGGSNGSFTAQYPQAS